MEELAAFWAMGMVTGVAVWLLRSLGKHWERKQERQLAQASGGPIADRVAELERQFEMLGGGLEARIAEVEERQDFAERLLTQAAREELPGERH